jgi:hypothetical protein
MFTFIQKNKYLLIIFFLVAVALFPLFGFAQDEAPNRLVPNCAGPNKECGYNDLLQLIKNILGWLIIVSVPVATGVIAWAGFVYMTSGIADKKSEAKSILTKVLIGFVFILSAWLIVSTLINALIDGNSSVYLPIKF